eukprot:3251979-Pyramimonas_sp.AAC.1
MGMAMGMAKKNIAAKATFEHFQVDTSGDTSSYCSFRRCRGKFAFALVAHGVERRRPSRE